MVWFLQFGFPCVVKVENARIIVPFVSSFDNLTFLESPSVYLWGDMAPEPIQIVGSTEL